MSTNLEWLLFEGSPFLPTVYQENINNIVSYVNDGHNSIVTAITVEVARLGNVLNDSHKRDLQSLKYNYEIDTLNITHFFYGYATPLQLLLCLDIMRNKSMEESLKHITNESQDPVIIELNQYKEKLIVPSAEIYFTATNWSPISVVFPIFDLCKKDPFVLDPYFLLGLEASRRKYWELFNYIEVVPNEPVAKPVEPQPPTPST